MNFLYLIKQLFLYDKYLKYRHHIKIEKDQREIYYLFKALDPKEYTYLEIERILYAHP